MVENYLKNDELLLNKNGSKSKIVSQNQNQLPHWMTLQTIISVITLISMITGFLVQNAIQNERAERLKLDFEVYKSQTAKDTANISEELKKINWELAKQEGAKEAQAEKRR